LCGCEIKKRARGNSAINQISPTFPRMKISTAIHNEDEYTVALSIPGQKEKREETRRNMEINPTRSPQRARILRTMAGDMIRLNIPPIHALNGA